MWYRLPLRLFNVIALPLHIGMAAGLLISLLAPYIHPANTTTLAAWFGLAYPFLLAGNLLFLFFWLGQRKKWGILLSLVLLPGLYAAGAYVQFRSPQSQKSADETDKPMRLLSLNAQLFGHFQSQVTSHLIANAMANENPDIICIQEFLHRGQGDTSTLSVFFKRTGLPYSYFERLNDGRKYGDYGMLILSRHKQINRGSVQIARNTGNMCIWADMVNGDDTFRVYNLHLQSIRFGRADYQFIHKGAEDNENRLRGSANILRRLNRAWHLRAAQSDSIRKHMESSPFPVIVCGDFNDVPLSYVYRRIGENLHDAFRSSGSGIDRTYQGPFPSFRIDYILHHAHFTAQNYQSIADVPSDHKMLRVDLIPTVPRQPK
jgi:endonuclease/exonuclease/phosphatase family metal-dependent hydrolase